MPKKDNTKQLIILLPKQKHKTFKNIVNDQEKFMQNVLEDLIDIYIDDYNKLTEKLKRKKK